MKINTDTIRNMATGAVIGIFLAGSVMGMISFLRGERDEYQIKRAMEIATEAKKGVDDMRDKLLLPRIATPEELNGQSEKK